MREPLKIQGSRAQGTKGSLAKDMQQKQEKSSLTRKRKEAIKYRRLFLSPRPEEETSF